MGRAGEDGLVPALARRGVVIKHRGYFSRTDWVTADGIWFESKCRDESLWRALARGEGPYIDTNKMDDGRVAAALWHDDTYGRAVWAPRDVVIASPVRRKYHDPERYDQPDSRLYIVPAERVTWGWESFVEFVRPRPFPCTCNGRGRCFGCLTSVRSRE